MTSSAEPPRNDVGQVTPAVASKLYGPARAEDVLALFAAAAEAVSAPEDAREAAVARLQSMVTPDMVLALVLEAAGSTATLQQFLTPTQGEPQHYEMRRLPKGSGAEMVPTQREGAGWVSAYEYRKVVAQLKALQ